MASVNKVILVGNLGRDPEVRYTQSGTAVANFTLATNEVWNDKAGVKQERTEWHRIVVWGKQAEVAREYLSKGRQVYIEGSLQTRQWDDKEGNKRSTTEIKANRVIFLGPSSQTGRIFHHWMIGLGPPVHSPSYRLRAEPRHPIFCPKIRAGRVTSSQDSEPPGNPGCLCVVK